MRNPFISISLLCCGLYGVACTSSNQAPKPASQHTTQTPNRTIWRGIRIDFPKPWKVVRKHERIVAYAGSEPSRCPTSTVTIDYVNPDQYEEEHTQSTQGTRCLESVHYSIREMKRGTLRIRCVARGSGEGAKADSSVCVEIMRSVGDVSDAPPETIPHPKDYPWFVQHSSHTPSTNTMEYFDPYTGLWSRAEVEARLELTSLTRNHQPAFFLQTEQHWSGARIVVLQPEGRTYTPVWDDYTFELAIGPKRSPHLAPDLIAYQDSGGEQDRRHVVCNRFAWDEKARRYVPSSAQCPERNAPNWKHIGPF